MKNKITKVLTALTMAMLVLATSSAQAASSQDVVEELEYNSYLNGMSRLVGEIVVYAPPDAIIELYCAGHTGDPDYMFVVIKARDLQVDGVDLGAATVELTDAAYLMCKDVVEIRDFI
jgi:hypothetical protein